MIDLLVYFLILLCLEFCVKQWRKKSRPYDSGSSDFIVKGRIQSSLEDVWSYLEPRLRYHQLIYKRVDDGNNFLGETTQEIITSILENEYLWVECEHCSQGKYFNAEIQFKRTRCFKKGERQVTLFMKRELNRPESIFLNQEKVLRPEDRELVMKIFQKLQKGELHAKHES